jgi:hypothetical protein
LLIGIDVFLVENDETDVFKGAKTALLGPHHNAGLPSGDPAVFVIAFPRGQLAMENRDLYFQSGAKNIPPSPGLG